MIDYRRFVGQMLHAHGLQHAIEVVDEEVRDLCIGDVIIHTGQEGFRGSSIVRFDRLVSLVGSNNHVQLIEYVKSVWKDAFMETVGKLLQPADADVSEDSDEEPTETE